MSIDDDIAAYLHFGYLPRLRPDWQDLPWIGSPDVPASTDHDGLIAEGLRQFRACFTDLSGSLHVVPLSGGLDSRAILAFLLEAGLRDKIVAVTFGVPRAFDYEFGRKVAQVAGVRHEAFNLNDMPLVQADLAQTARELNTTGWTHVIDATYNRLVCRHFGPNAVYWSGYMIDSLTGSHLPVHENTQWVDAVTAFTKYNRYSQSATLTPPDFRPNRVLPATPPQPRSELNFDEQLDFTVRQEACIRPLVLPVGYEYRVPFMRPEWVKFILGVPRPARLQQHLYIEMLRNAYPQLFALPTKNNMGLPFGSRKWRLQLRGVRLGIEKTGRRLLPRAPWPAYPATNYIDFDRALRHDEALKALFHSLLHSLKVRNATPWLDIDALWREHQQAKGNHGFALRVLVGLELLLQARDAAPSV